MIFDGGVENEKFNICKMELKIRNISKNNPSVSFADSSLYTREPVKPACQKSRFYMLHPYILPVKGFPLRGRLEKAFFGRISQRRRAGSRRRWRSR